MVYSVVEEGEKNLKKARVLHRNMLLPVSQWFELEKPTKCPKRKEEKVNKPHNEKQKEIRGNCEAADVQKEVDSEEEENEEWFAFYPLSAERQVLEVDVPKSESGESEESTKSEAETIEYDDEEALLLLEEVAPIHDLTDAEDDTDGNEIFLEENL